jgi:cytochrome P450
LDDFFQALMEDKNSSSNNLEWGEIVAEVDIMMNAGSVTTAIAIANCMYQLLKHPQILEQLREEVDAALDPEDVVAPYDKVKHLPYLRACLDESLRLFPPTPHGLPRTTHPRDFGSTMSSYRVILQYPSLRLLLTATNRPFPKPTSLNLSVF